jgi:cytoskeleton protein RodZ
MSDTLGQMPATGATDGLTSPNGLRVLREEAGLHVVALAAMLKVPVQRLEALEAGRYQELPDMTFARALASSICRVLKVDPVPVLATLPGAQSVRLGVSEKNLNTPFREASSGNRAAVSAPSGGGASFKPAWAAAVLVVVAAVLWWTLPVADAPDLSVPVVRTPLPEGDVPMAVPTTPDPVLALAPSVTPVPPATAAVNAADGAVAAGVSTTGTATVPASGVVLRLAARDTVWVEVVGLQNKLLLQRNLQPGESVEFSSDAPYRVTSGRADVVDVTVRGQAFDVLSKARNNVARFEVQ